MDNQQALYNGYFKAQDRFLEQHTPCGFEPDVIHDYIHWALTLSSVYERGEENENPLLCEFYLRQVYFHLLDAIQDALRSRTFRRVCLDAVHTPLFSLKRYYDQWENGDIKFIELQHQLQRLRTPLD
ncbi:hypothetical protein ACODM8_10075 [Vibrio ostreicida]|uniref:Uncharacterized protein n=1 Tax=Vibrio ostreicida TaxID=526588 RepID=A0ABT8BZX1_9VIBR|nr:hypothetical protein [Vibrio ostreicida]MDN3611931.1 hypothetical protein [Vibrio ostreicida]NPD08888.1 hypothetical protein [Vibrio ostreicida]